MVAFIHPKGASGVLIELLERETLSEDPSGVVLQLTGSQTSEASAERSS
jgi:hypothetical protein